MQLLLNDIRQIVTVAGNGAPSKRGSEMRKLGVIENGFILVEDSTIAQLGAGSFAGDLSEDATVLDCTGFVALPGFVDSHTHLLFAGSRANEFAMRAEGKSYQEIAAAGGGILSTVAATRAASKKELKKLARHHLDAMMQLGTTTCEIKSGYGLNEESERKMLECINELADEHLMEIVPTFLAAHAVPPEFAGNPDAYVELICERMLPYVAQRKLATFCDAFCETNYFSVEQTRRIFHKARSLGLDLRIHADQLTQIGASRLAAEMRAASIDHLECVDEAGIAAIKASGSVATLLPGVSFFLNYGYPPARALIDAGIPLAIATNFNPGSCMSYSMPLMMTIASTNAGMSVEEVIAAATLNGAASLKRSDRLGSLEPGKQADIILYDIPDYRHLVYHFGVNHVSKIIKRGTLLEF